MPRHAPRPRLAIYTILGSSVTSSVMMIFGAAIGGAVPSIPSASEAYAERGIGGVLGTILTARFGAFGSFILVILGLTSIAACSRELYSLSFAIPSLFVFLDRVPRALLAVVSAGCMIGLAIPASRSFVDSLTTFLSIVGYYSAGNATCFILEILWFRCGDLDSLDPVIWNDGARLPTGISSLTTIVASWGLIVPTMDQPWYTGPVARVTGDLGFMVAVAFCLVVYIPLRSVELAILRRRESVRCMGVQV